MSTISDFIVLIKPYLVGIAAILIIVGGYEGLQWYKVKLKTNEAALQQQIKDAQTQIDALTKEKTQLLAAKTQVDADNVKLQSNLDIAKHKADSDIVVPKPSTPPADEVKLVADLKQDGVEFKPLQGQIFSTDHTSLPTIWTWDKEAARVPSLEIKLTDTQTALTASSNLTDGLNKRIVISDKLNEDCEKTNTLKDIQIGALNKQVSTEHREIVVAETKGWVRLVIAVPATWFVAKQVYKK